MNELENFQELKKRILETYQKSYLYFQGDWKSFSSKDIRQLIDLVEIQCKERVSEKWIYTHLKPESNRKLPRKDMLDIFSKFCGFTGWDEFVFQNKIKTPVETIEKPIQKPSKKWFWFLLLLPLIGLGIYFFGRQSPKIKTVEIKNEYTKEPVQTEDIQIYKVQDEEKIPVEIQNSKFELEDKGDKILIESPYFEKKEVEVSKSTDEILIKPEDYAMVLKNFILSDLKDWENRKEKLDKILSDDLEVIIMLKDNLGAEYLNKEEFSGKLIVPTSETKKMKILDLKTNGEKEIIFIRIQVLWKHII